MSNHFAFSNSDKVKTPSLITPWSFIHFINGCYMYTFGNYITDNIFINLLIGLIIHTIYEVVTLLTMPSNNIPKWKNNSITNSIGDTVCFILGFILMYVGSLNQKYKHIITLIYYSSFSLIFSFFSLD